MSQIWGKGFDIDQAILEFTAGEDHILDEKLVAFDIKASQAHVLGLAHVGHISHDEAARLCDALREIGEQHARGEWTISLAEEDCHTALESRLITKLRELGEKVHLGRSRNDQVLVALRLFMLDATDHLRELGLNLATALDDLAIRHPDFPLPGYTHMQRAMPSSVQDWANGYAAEIRQSLGLLDAAYKLADLCPLGSAAGYGTPGLELDRLFVAQELGMELQEPVTACQLSRGKAESALAFAIATILGDTGRLAADLCLFNTAEFGFVKLPDAMTTGSSIMPQKRNPDVFELVRGHSAESIADLNAILLLTTKMPSGYHRDLQLIKPPLFRTINRGQTCLAIMAHAVEGVQFQKDKCEKAMSPELYAAQEAFELVKTKGLTFRAAYREVAKKHLP